MTPDGTPWGCGACYGDACDPACEPPSSERRVMTNGHVLDVLSVGRVIVAPRQSGKSAALKRLEREFLARNPGAQITYWSAAVKENAMSKAEIFVNSFEQGVDKHPHHFVTSDMEEMSETYEIVSTNRWSSTVVMVYRFDDDSFVQFNWEDPSTEMQEGQPWNTYTEVVVPKTVETVIYVTADKA